MSEAFSQSEYEYEYSDDENLPEEDDTYETDEDMEYDVEDNPNAAPVLMNSQKGEKFFVIVSRHVAFYDGNTKIFIQQNNAMTDLGCA